MLSGFRKRNRIVPFAATEVCSVLCSITRWATTKSQSESVERIRHSKDDQKQFGRSPGWRFGLTPCRLRRLSPSKAELSKLSSHPCRGASSRISKNPGFRFASLNPGLFAYQPSGLYSHAGGVLGV